MVVAEIVWFVVACVACLGGIIGVSVWWGDTSSRANKRWHDMQKPTPRKVMGLYIAAILCSAIWPLLIPSYLITVASVNRWDVFPKK